MSNREWLYRIYGRTRHCLNRVLRRTKESNCHFVYVYTQQDAKDIIERIHTLNGVEVTGKSLPQKLLFCGENITFDSVTVENTRKIDFQETGLTEDKLWKKCIEGAKIEPGWRNSGLYHTAYTKETGKWCLSNWIWTSAAIGRVLCVVNPNEGVKVADAFIEQQLNEGGWIVRYDIIKGNLIRLAAPNDSAYIANNSLISAYRTSGDTKYLFAAEKCAEWIMNSALENGLVPFGYDVDKSEWIIDHNIVDIGFTADLFCQLYKETKEQKYLDFAQSFIAAYINAYYDKESGLFSTYIGSKGERLGGFFSRGQAWALEGLIPIYEITKDDRILQIIERQTLEIVSRQLPNGGWPCNFQGIRRLMGEDCKGIACIAKNLAIWTKYSQNSDKLWESVEAAYKWCIDHTDIKSGMILSFSTDGAIEHSPNSSTGMLYANAYAIEVGAILHSYSQENEDG